MRYHAVAFIVFAVLVGSTIPGFAQPSRVFVAAQGSDTNPCSFAAPCRSFQHAHDTAAAGGEIDVLDPAGYGEVTISKAISIQGHGFAGASASSGDAITITAGASDTVSLTGILIEGNGKGNNGITYNSAAVVQIQNCAIHDFAGRGISVVSTSRAEIEVADTTVSDSSAGVGIQPPSGSSIVINAFYERVEVLRVNGAGFFIDGSAATGSIEATASDSAAVGGANGFEVFSPSGKATVGFMLTNVRAANNGQGLNAIGPNATISLTGSTISGNENEGFVIQSGSTIVSYGNNTIIGPNGGSLTPGELQ